MSEDFDPSPFVETSEAFAERVRQEAIEAVTEAERAIRRHGPMHSLHEGYAVLLEEVDELWDELKADRKRQEQVRLAKAIGAAYVPDPAYLECIQIAAVALRLAAIVRRLEQLEAEAGL